ncbi:MAG: CoA activase, partial [Acidobacteria bacterium]|nr:CoA activase [Acidobacteriota bacterium]
STRCHFCSNECLRTFVDIHAPAQDSSRFILATCEKGEVEDEGRMREIRSATDDMRRKNPDLSAYAARAAFQIPSPPAIDPRLPRWPLTAGMRARRNLVQRRATLRIGMPRVLNFYSVAPLFTAYFRSLGIAAKNLVFSSHTTEELYAAGGKRGSVDPCFPSKVAIPHVHNLIAVAHATSPLHVIFFPMLDCLDSPLRGTPASRACPTVTATPAAVKAAFARERDEFHDHGIRFVDTFLNLSQPALLERQMYADWAPILGLSPRENRLAVEAGYRHLAQFQSKLRQRGKDVLASLEREGRLGIVLLGRPYHNDPGLHHGIPEELQKLGYPILTQDALPMDSETLNRLFGAEVRAGLLPDPLSVTDVWKNAYSENTSRKVWAAKFTARHPNLVALEISSFKCGHDAPVYSLIEQILEASATPYFSFKDIDENKPAGAMRLRLETMHYFLTRYQEDLNSAAPQRSSPVRLEWSLHAAPKIDVPLAALQA